MTTHRFNNTATPKEKAEVLRNDLAVLRKARALLDLHAIAKPAQSAIGSVALYPRQPPNSPWSGPQVPIEPVLGYSVDAPQARRRR